MAHTYTALHYHFIFATRNREPWIGEAIEGRLWSYLAATADHHGMKALRIGGIADHLHLLVGAPPSLAPSDAVKVLKGSSSRWLSQTFPELAGFAWQSGYAALTVSRESLPRVTRYIARQRAHHAEMSFTEELELFRKRYGILLTEH